jgi:hypothetical protein
MRIFSRIIFNRQSTQQNLTTWADRGEGGGDGKVSLGRKLWEVFWWERRKTVKKREYKMLNESRNSIRM